MQQRERYRERMSYSGKERFKGETNNENGIWPAIEEFLEENKHWSVCEIFTNNNGLTIIKNNG